MALLRRADMVNFAGPMVAAEFGGEVLPTTEDAFWKILTERRPRRILSMGQESVLCEGEAEGMLIGGNLAVYSSLVGSSYLPDPAGAILFLEEVGENVYRIDRMLLQLKLAGILSSVAGVVVGSFTAVPEDEPNRELEAVLTEYLKPLGIPVIKDFPFGHIPEKITMPMGARVRLDTKKRQLTVMQAVVS